MFNRDKTRAEELWLIRAGSIFGGLLLLSLVLHYFGSSPYGGSILESPWRFIFNAVMIDFAATIALVFLFWLGAMLFGLRGLALRIPFVLLALVYTIIHQFDLEVVRWLNEHITMSYVNNYLHKTDGELLKTILASDLPASIAAGIQMLLPIPFGIWLLTRKWNGKIKQRTAIILAILFVVLAASPEWLMYSEKRWRRICPIAFSLTKDALHDFWDLDAPRNPKQAYADLLQYAETGTFADKPLDIIPEFPIYHAQGPGHLTPQEFKKLPKEKRPNIIFVIMETWRGWRSGLVHDQGKPSYFPKLDSVLEHEAYYFPYVHSLGFPSVEGAQNIHLGTWPHFNKIILSSFCHDRFKSLPEIFRDLGYHAEITLGTDPSFDNLTLWLQHWYDRLEYDIKNDNDSLLINRDIRIFDTLSRTNPFFLTTWTLSTHPPYAVPPAPELKKASTEDEHYEQAANFSERQVLRYIDHIRHSDQWKNTIIVLVGDHAQPEPDIRSNSSIAGSFTPGHTWVHAAFLGGWPGLPAPKRNEETVPSIDIAPTLLELVDASVPNHFMGHSLLHPKSQEFLSFRWNSIALHRENDRVLFDMYNSNQTWFKLNKQIRSDYALLIGHSTPQSDSIPFPFDKERYRDMVRAFAELLDDNKIFPRDESKLGVYDHLR